jgi:hypothetical protein
VRWTWKVKVFTHLELELMNELRERAEEEAIRIFGKNLKDLLLAAPAGQHVTMGIDPGIRTGCKLAVVDATGKLLDTPPFTRTNRAATGAVPSPPSPAWRLDAWQVSWSPSATARPAAKPTSWSRT